VQADTGLDGLVQFEEFVIYFRHGLSLTVFSPLAGGLFAAAVLVPASWYVAGPTSYQQFYEHTIKVHDHTPLTNHMGLRVLLSGRPGCISDFPKGYCTGMDSGRMKWSTDNKLPDAFTPWKRLREERYAARRPLAYAIIALSFAGFVLAVKRVRSMFDPPASATMSWS
jgi:hypothetical protein